MRKRKSKEQFSELLGIFLLICFSAFLISIILVSLISYFMLFRVRTGPFQIPDSYLPKAGHLILFIAFFSVILSLVIITVSGKIWLRPVNRLIDGMSRLASGDYSARLDVGRHFKKLSVLRLTAESFNKMAEELQNTEVLRSDFINNFSHEFKTPIVSIAGFAKLLRRGGLSEEEKAEYAAIIEEESLRLSYMATNVLNLTKVENQTILTDVSVFNLSEQIRSCVLLLENKWIKKRLELNIDFAEYMISADEEGLKHVWINLIDNAIKFSPEGGILKIKIRQDEKYIYVSVSNNGRQIPKNAHEKIFNKFYQADESHAADGNGIGLAIVKRITELHGGKVSAESNENLTTFTVMLPKEQNL